MAEKPATMLPGKPWEYILVAAFFGGGVIDFKTSDSVADQLAKVQDTLTQMAASLSDTSRALAVVVSKLEDHDRRLENLEDYERHRVVRPAPSIKK